MAIDTSPWNGPQLAPISPPPENFSELCVEEAAELIKDWFFANFEDPAHSTPHDSGEGGYQYIWGGPYEADDVIANVFADVASDEIIQAAIEAVESEGFEWAPAGHRVLPPDEEKEDEELYQEGLDAAALHAQMLERIDELERALESVRPPGIGHNHPPEPLEDQPLAADDYQAILDAISVVRSQPTEPSAMPLEAVEAATALRKVGTKISDYLDAFTIEMMKAAGAETGKWMVRLPAWGLLAKALAVASGAVMAWIHALHF